MRLFRFIAFHFALVMFAAVGTSAQTQLSADLIEKIDKVATDTLARTGVLVTARQRRRTFWI